MRTFETGATRDTDETKHDPEGFLSPLVIQRFNEYMAVHRVQADGAPRDSDNWTKGIPPDAYVKSLLRHVLDIWLHHRKFSDKTTGSLEDALCATMFNAMGLLYEVLQDTRKKATSQSPVSKDLLVLAAHLRGLPKQEHV